MKKFFYIFLMVGICVTISSAQLASPLNMPGTWNGFTNPPATGSAFLNLGYQCGGPNRYVGRFCVSADAPAGAQSFKLTSDAFGNPYGNQWSLNGGTVVFNTPQLYQYCSSCGAMGNTNITLTAGRCYTVLFQSMGYGNTNVNIIETAYTPKTLTNIVLTKSPSCLSTTVQMSASATLSAGEFAYVRYSFDNFATSTIVAVTMLGATGTATIPPAPPGATVSYYGFTSNQASIATFGTNGVNADMNSIHLINGAGSTGATTATAASGCLNLSYVIPNLPTAAITGTTTVCTGSPSTVLSASTSTPVSGFMATYQWGGAATQGPNLNPNLSTTVAGTYTVTVTNSFGCTKTASIDVTTAVAPTATITGANSFCPNGNTTLSAATSTAGAGSIVSYEWFLNDVSIQGPSASATLLATQADNYKVKTVNTNGCCNTSAATAVTAGSAPAAPTATTTVNYCQDAMAMPLVATGTNLKWYASAASAASSTSAPTPTTVAAGTTSYFVSQTNAAGCESPRLKIDVVVKPKPTVTASVRAASCTPTNVGTAEITVQDGTAGYTYAWSNGTSGTSVTGAGTYSVVVTDSNATPAGCTATVSGIIVP